MKALRCVWCQTWLSDFVRGVWKQRHCKSVPPTISHCMGMGAYGMYADVDPIERSIGVEGGMKSNGYFEGVNVGVGGGYEVWFTFVVSSSSRRHRGLCPLYSPSCLSPFFAAYPCHLFIPDMLRFHYDFTFSHSLWRFSFLFLSYSISPPFMNVVTLLMEPAVALSTPLSLSFSFLPLCISSSLSFYALLFSVGAPARYWLRLQLRLSLPLSKNTVALYHSPPGLSSRSAYVIACVLNYQCSLIFCRLLCSFIDLSLVE